jgi:hypothetical protein
MIVFRAALALYLLLLSFLLLAPEPLKLLGFPSSSGASSLRMVHFTLFAVLGFLAWASRWPVRSRTLLGVLVGYALVTESLQWFIVERSVELLDYAENLLGLAAGGAVWHALQWWGRSPSERRGAEQQGAEAEAPTALKEEPPEG